MLLACCALCRCVCTLLLAAADPALVCNVVVIDIECHMERQNAVKRMLCCCTLDLQV
jgi:hypothetical protein